MQMPGVRRFVRTLLIVAVLMVALGAAPGSAMATISSHITTPFVPAHVYRNVPITVSGQIDKAAATGQIKLLFYQKLGDTWRLQKSEYARWSGYTDTTTKFLSDVSFPYAGTWRIGASYGGNATYASAYTYRDFVVEMPDAHLSTPFVPAHVVRNIPITVTGFVDKAAATGPIRMLFYQKIGDTWKLQKTEYARWSGYTSTVTKYLCDTSLPYTGTWRIGASYGGNTVYPCDYTYRDIVVEAPYAAGLGLTLSDATPPAMTSLVVGALVLNQVGKPIAGATVSFVWDVPSIAPPPGAPTLAPKVYYTDANGYVACVAGTGMRVGDHCAVTATATYGGRSVSKSTSFVTGPYESQIGWY